MSILIHNILFKNLLLQTWRIGVNLFIALLTGVRKFMKAGIIYKTCYIQVLIYLDVFWILCI